MLSYRYQYIDAHGREAEDVIQAVSEKDAYSLLAQKGVRNAMIMAAMATHTPQVIQPQASTPVDIVKTRKGKDSGRHFLFSQVADQLYAGIPAPRVFDEIYRVTHESNPFRESLREISAAATNGYPLADAMARYPYLYPPHVIGMVRAGEHGGFVPQAFAHLAEQAQSSHHFKRFHWFIWFIASQCLPAIPLMFLVRHALLDGWKRASADESRAGTAFLDALRAGFIWPYGPIALLMGAILFLVNRWLSSLPMTRFRHEIGLKVPIYGPRARNECVASFVWAMSHLAKGGLSPQSAWKLAADCVPNIVMRDRLMEAGSRMHDGSRISEAIFASAIFPHDYAPTISTGELTGNIVGALETLEKASRNDFQVATGKARFRSMSLGCTFFLIVSGFLVARFTYAWFNEFYPTILKDFETP